MLKVKINETKKFNTKRKEKLMHVAKKLEVVVNHPYFKDLFLKQDFSGELSHWKNKSPEEIYDHLMSGKELQNPEADKEIDVYVTLFYRRSKVIGYTKPSTIRTWINKKYFDYFGHKRLAANVLHEYGHNLGFKHDRKKTKRRPYSICYRLSYCVNKTYEHIFNNK